MSDVDSVISHLHIINTWASFARERDLSFFTDEHLESIEQWTNDALAILKEQKARTGYWNGQECSVCHAIVSNSWSFDYCPYCGSAMIGHKRKRWRNARHGEDN